jgi:hypothetical protein
MWVEGGVGQGLVVHFCAASTLETYLFVYWKLLLATQYFLTYEPGKFLLAIQVPPFVSLGTIHVQSSGCLIVEEQIIHCALDQWWTQVLSF